MEIHARMSFEPTSTTNPWRSISRKNLVIFLAAVFCTFTAIGIISDVSGMGSQSYTHYAINALLSGLFAIAYAYGGITLRGKFWKIVIPIIILQMVVMTIIANVIPNHGHRPIQLNPAETSVLATRLNFDATAISLSVSLGYAGFVMVFIRESRRHIRIETEKAVLESEMQ